MPSYKNQHFVPRAHLKPFTASAEGRTISLYNERRDRFIHGASVGDQCSRDYFYGRDNPLEQNLGELEERYASLVREIVAAGQNRPKLSLTWLRMFWSMQWARTEAAAQLAKSMAGGIKETFGVSLVEGDPSEVDWVFVALGCFQRAYEMISDLPCIIVRNRLETPFITSDNPAAITNRFHLVQRRGKLLTFGMGSAGALLVLPLSPDHLALFYDADVYTIDHRNGWLDLRNVRDVLALNQHQILNCKSNLYFAQAREFEWIRPAFEALRKERERPQWKYHYAVRDGGDNGRERYRFTENQKIGEHRESIIVTQGVPRCPTLWPSFLRWRLRGVAFETLNLATVRAAEIERNPLLRYRVVRISN